MTRCESDVQALTRLKHSPNGVLWRNNVGVAMSANGQPVRYGLANESKQMNQEIKSADLIGWTNITITPEMVGKTIPVFTSVEVKKEGYKPTGKQGKAHYKAQCNWRDRCRQHGCIAGIIDRAEDVVKLVTEWIEVMSGK